MLAKVSVTTLCAHYEVSRSTAYKFFHRFLRFGRAGLEDAKRGRRSGGLKRFSVWRKAVLRLRQKRSTWGARKLLWKLKQRPPDRQTPPSERTVQRWLRANGAIRIRRPKPHRSQPSIAQPTLALEPNDVWTFDFKGPFRTCNGERVEPLTVRDLATRYLLTAQPVRQRSDAVVRAVCIRLFQRFGVPKVIRVDLGTPFCGVGPHGLTALSLWWHRLGIRVEFVQRRRGVHNNEHEQMHRVLKAEATQPSCTLAAQAQRLRRWCRTYNFDRPHEAIGMIPPAQLYQPSARRFCPPPPEQYPPQWKVRRVRQRGEVMLDGRNRQIGRAFTGLDVGFEPTTNGYLVYCGTLLIGSVEPQRSPHLLPTTKPLYTD